MNNAVDEIKKKLNIVDFINQYSPVKKAGRNFKALCPFHSEKTPSFVISPDRQIWHCFGACQDGGDVIKFFMKIENITFFEALQELARQTGVTLDKNAVDDQAWKKKEKLYEINKLAAEFYHFLLTKHKIGEKARTYLESRNTSQKIIESFEIGYSPAQWSALTDFLKKKGFAYEEIERTGLILKGKNGYYDRFRKRIVFPLKDHRNNIIGFSGRIIEGNEKEAKYINTPETEIYHKRETLFGIQLTYEAIRKKESVIIVEGEFDMISCYQHGLSNVVAVKGSAVTREQLKFLKRCCKKLILALDADKSGQETIKRTIPEAEEEEFEVQILPFIAGKDPDEALKNDAIAFKKLADKPVPLYDFIIDITFKNNSGEDAFTKKKIAEEIVPFFVYIKNPIIYEFYVKKVAELLNTSYDSIDYMIKKNTKMIKIGYDFHKEDKKVKVETNRFELLQKYILCVIFQNEFPLKMADIVFNIIDIEDFTQVAYRKLLDSFITYKKTLTSLDKKEYNMEAFIQSLPQEVVYVFDEILLSDMSMFNVHKSIKELEKMIYEFKRTSVKQRIKAYLQDPDKGEDVKKLTHILSDIEKKLVVL